MHWLTLVHRWLGILFCLLFAMWFASGLVMHFVPFPSLSETERIEGLAPLDMSRVLHGPAEAVDAAGSKDIARVRLQQRSDGPVYLLSDASGVAAFHADDLTRAAIGTEDLAAAVAVDHARRRGKDVRRAAFVELAAFDQWTMAGGLDRRRPFFRVVLNDEVATELYVSSVTGEVVQGTTRFGRRWNYVGSVAHWIYPVVLRSKPALWDAALWSLSLAALMAAAAGSLLGLLRIRKIFCHRRFSPGRSLHWWHHVLGLLCASFVLSWIFSGWLSMDNGRLFSTGRPAREGTAALATAPAWKALSADQGRPVLAEVKEIEWFALDQKFFRRERTGPATQRLFSVPGADETQPPRESLGPSDIGAFAQHLAAGCKPPFVTDAEDNYAIASVMPGAPVYRSVCGDVWFQIDGADGAILERLDSSRRAYRWLYSALHTMDIPALTSRPALRGALIVVLASLGLAFSLTGAVIGWRRLGLHFSSRWR